MRMDKIKAVALAVMLCGCLASSTALAALPNGLRGSTAQEVFGNDRVAALANAACAGNTAEIHALAHSGVNVNTRGKAQISPLIWAMTCHHNYAGIQTLLQNGANPNQPMEYGQTPVWLAAGGSDPKILPILLAHGGDPNAYCAECQGTSALENAIDYRRTANMKLLVQRGANVNFVGALSPGERAVAQGHFNYVIYLLQHGYDHDLQGLANAILQKKGMFNPHWGGYSMWKWQYPYWKESLQKLAAKGYKAHKIPRKTLPMNPPPSPAAGSQ